MQQKVLITIKMVAGLMLVVFGANKFFGFLDMAAPAIQMGMVMKALGSTGYLFPLVGGIEVLVGLAFILNRFVALGAVLLAPVMLNAFMMHLMLDPSGIAGSALLGVMLIIIMISEKSRFSGLLKA